MAHPRDTRRLALQMLYQFDSRGADDPDAIKASLLDASHDPSRRYEGPWAVRSPLDPRDHDRAFEVARAAWDTHEEADRLATELAPAWPTSRQPAMDRNVIRLCWYEMASGRTPPKVAVNEAIELAKEFGTERSAAFLNGVLDRLLRVILRRQGEAVEIDAMHDLPDESPEATPSGGTTATPEPVVEHTEFWSSDH